MWSCAFLFLARDYFLRRICCEFPITFWARWDRGGRPLGATGPRRMAVGARGEVTVARLLL